MSYMDKMMKQSCDFAKECDRAFKKKHIGVNLILLHFVCINKV